MAELYRARFSLGNSHRKPRFEEVVEFTNRKLTQASQLQIVVPSNGHESINDGKDSLDVAHMQSSNEQIYAIQWQSCKDDANWRVDFGLRDKAGQDPLVEVTMARDMASDVLVPSGGIIKRPGIVPALINQFGAHSFERLSDKPFRITPNNVGEFINFIRNPARDLPIVFMSCSNSLRKPLLDPRDIASRLAGVSYIFVEEDSSVTLEAKEKFGDLICFNGAVRLYWPIKGAGQIFHPLWTIDDQKQQRVVPATLCRIIYGASIARPAMINYPRVMEELSERERQGLMKKIEESKSLGDYEELVRLYEQEIGGLRENVTGLQGRIESLTLEAQKTATERDALRMGTIELQKQLAEAQTKQVVEPEKPLENMNGAYEKYLKTYSEGARNIIFHPRGVRRIEKSKFKDPETFFNLLCWINDTFVRSRRGELSVPDLDISCRENVDMTFVPNQSEVTIGEHPEEYEIIYDGAKYTLKEHFRRGTTRDEEESLRVAGVTLPEKYAKRFLLGYVGFHQPNRKT